MADTPQVLVVEDEVTARNLLVGYLEEQGWQVDSLQEAASVLTQVAPKRL